MNLCKLVITCQRLVRCVQNRYGTCLGRQLLMNVKGMYKNSLDSFADFINRKFFVFIFIFFFRCRIKVHKEHIDNNDPLAPCKLHHDPNSARDLLLLATNAEDQTKWVSRLSKRIQKSGYKANSITNNNLNNTSGDGGTKISPR